MNSFIRSVQPLASAQQLEEIQELSQNFLAEDATDLANKLAERDEDNASRDTYPYSFIEEIWDHGYLDSRSPIAVNVNPIYLLADNAENTFGGDSIKGISALSVSLAKWVVKLRSMDLDVDSPLCLSPYLKVVGSARIPKKDTDEGKHHPDSRHVAVLHQGVFYPVQLLTEANEVIGVPELQAKLSWIATQPGVSPESSVAALTGGSRPIWADARAEICTSPANREAIDTVDSAMFVLCLDSGEGAMSTAEASSAALHGDGSVNQSRWFDKLQVIALHDGQIALNFEHSFTDGMSWNRMLSEAIQDMKGLDAPRGCTPLPKLPVAPASANPQPLTFDLSDTALQAIAAARSDFDTLTQNVDLESRDFCEYGRNDIKQWKVSPDAIAQAAFMLAYFRVHDKPPAVYEACSMQSYFHGRTETIRSMTTEMGAFVRGFDGADKATREELLRAACGRHIEVAKEAQAGAGVDRYLLAVQMLAGEAPMSASATAFFEHPLYSASQHFNLSTSNVSAPFLKGFSFGPTVADGYGIGYMTAGDRIPISTTSLKDDPTTIAAADMQSQIEQALVDIGDIF